ncbi:MAG: SDR family oxidoreductase [Myxococcales bacterium]|nr:SDR family oxidoreductase [Myxococcales bacterium]
MTKANSGDGSNKKSSTTRPTITPRKTRGFAPDLLKGRVILVTGGGTGLGFSMAQGLGLAGAHLLISARNVDRLGQAADTLRSQGITVDTIGCDVRDAEQVAAMVRRGVELCGHIDGLINNAAGNFLCPSEDLTPGGFDAVVKIVLYGTVHCTLAVGRHLIERGAPGSIVSILTPYAWTGSPFVLPSACAKSGVMTMTRSLAIEWGVYGIRLNAIAPGPFPTEGAWKALVPDAGLLDGMIEKRIPMARVGEHSELANMAVFLMSDLCPYQNGDTVTLDGGGWLAGASEFGEYGAYPREPMKQLLRAMRPPKK